MRIVSQLDHNGYFTCAVLADECQIEPGVYHLPGGAVDADPPDTPSGHSARWVEGAWEFAPAAHPAPPTPAAPLTPEQIEANALLRIDGDTDDIYRAVIGFRAPEYQATEREAIAFQSAGFEGETPPTIASWVQASGMSAQDATVDVLAQAATWHGAVLHIRNHRLRAKSQVRTGQVDEAMSAWATFVAGIRNTLEI